MKIVRILIRMFLGSDMVVMVVMRIVRFCVIQLRPKMGSMFWDGEMTMNEQQAISMIMSKSHYMIRYQLYHQNTTK